MKSQGEIAAELRALARQASDANEAAVANRSPATLAGLFGVAAHHGQVLGVLAVDVAALPAPSTHDAVVEAIRRDVDAIERDVTG